MISITSFQAKVYRAVAKLRPGETTSYAAIAREIGHPRAYRAVGGALSKNPFSPMVPCHRVVRSDGQIGGYAGGIRRKRALLRREGAPC